MDEITRRVQAMYSSYPYPGYGTAEHFHEDAVEKLIEILKRHGCRLRGGQILDVGCGTGHTSVCFARKLPETTVLGVDISPGSLDVAERYRHEAAIHNLEYRLLDITKEPPGEEAFDFAYLSGSLHHTSEPEVALRHVVRALRPGGFALVSVYSRYNNQERYRNRDLLSVLVPNPEDYATKVAVARELIPDARNKSDAEIIDAYAHCHERDYTYPELVDLMEQTGLTFLEWPGLGVPAIDLKLPVSGRLVVGLSPVRRCALAEILLRQMVMITALGKKAGG
ncbi:MAG TPA: class I SAM-dependent methyltransferase [bacterium]|nr:class I SAM-dependent methyltransferase [bacterium]HQL62387.1 class I SAM-dependent methyltransferase [bacterium]